MSSLIQILKRVKSGEMSFQPKDRSSEAIKDFQIISKALSHAQKEGLIERCLLSKDSFDGNLFYNSAIVIGGLTFKGEEFLLSKTTFKGWLRIYSPSIVQWVFGILAGLALAALARWLIPK